MLSVLSGGWSGEAGESSKLPPHFMSIGITGSTDNITDIIESIEGSIWFHQEC